jgi:thiol:disulfide interchange protein
MHFFWLRILRGLFFLALTSFAQVSGAFTISDLNATPNTVSDSLHNQQITTRLLAYAPENIAPGKSLWLGVFLSPQPGWHTYWRNPGDSGMASQLQWQLPYGLTAGPTLWPTPQHISLGDISDFGYPYPALLLTKIQIPANVTLPATFDIKLHAKWLVCKTECIPQDGQFSLTVVSHQPLTQEESLFKKYLLNLPKSLSGQANLAFDGTHWQLQVTGLPATWRGKTLSLYPETADIVTNNTLPSSDKPQVQKWLNDIWQAQITPKSSYDLSNKKNAFIDIANKHDSVRTEVVFDANQLNVINNTNHTEKNSMSLILIILASIVGGMILNLMPCVFPVLAIKILAISNNSEHRRSHSIAYGVGVIAFMLLLGGLLLLLRAGGSEIGWGFQLQSPVVLTILALLFTLIGLNLIGIFEVGSILPSSVATQQLQHPLANSFLSGLLTVAVASPCTAPFMGASLGYAIGLPVVSALCIFAALGLGLALPYVILCWAPVLARFLPKPGLWMVQLRQFFAFPMWLTVAWILWVMSQLNGNNAAFSLLALVVCVALLIWALSLQARARWIYSVIALFCIIALVRISFDGLFFHTDQLIHSTADPSKTKRDWTPWTPSMVATALAENRPVLVEFTAAWCITCQYNKTVLMDPEIQKIMQKKRVLRLVADWTNRDDAITQALQALNRNGVPTCVIYIPGHAPILLSELLTRDEVIQQLNKL